MPNRSERIPQRIPTVTPEEIAQREHDLAILDSDPRTAGKANRPAWLVEHVLTDHRTRSRMPTVTRRQLPAISVSILPVDHAMLSGCRVVAIVPRADLQAYAIAYRIAADVTAAIAVSAGSNGPLSQVGLPQVVAGRQSTCTTVEVHCSHAHEAADVVQLVEAAARAAATITACGARGEENGSTHRVVRS